ncbi:Na/Pi cotransporter [Candidatus Saganbacteria bacterium CG08_land_8_20_14_0_20_45_16]|uniref:Na/Pi cotransporter n=1 Tax=Candidatus Saganbacteria bacterium CG08_land_8_20_14_0_20_45_16 TaxID=2014293 RepID=A0A2H0XY18_UNCSA|nr:MAG: Na/Pi cotransporter [Candidatus Saganbacteria bacterium CG08_land_8_20_14_0_20_45_16]
MTDNIFFGIFGGLGLFLFGMRIMSEGLQKVACKSMRRILEMLTKTTIAGVAVGAGVTAIIQSSSATTVMLIGFVQAGLMTLKQAIGVVYGANIGTTITAQLIAFKIHKYALPAIGLGVLLNFFVPRKNLKYFGQILLGFGLLFFGLQVMTDVFAPMKTNPQFQQLFVTFSHNPLLAVLTGALLTMVVQSSSVTVAVTMTLAGVGLLDFVTAFAVVLGDNIGTTITAQLAAIGGNITAKRTAWVHTLFNLFGAGYMLLLLNIKIGGEPIFLHLVNLVTPGNAFAGENIERAVANSHSIFNILNCIIFIPLAGVMAFVVTKLIKGEVEVIEHGVKHLNEKMVVAPEIAIGQAKKEIVRMANYAQQQLALSIEAVFATNNRLRDKLFEKVKHREETVNLLEREIASFLIKIDQESITEEQSRITAAYLHLIHDIERIGDISENILDLVELKEEENIKFSEIANVEIRQLDKYVEEAVCLTITAFDKWDKIAAQNALEIEGKIDATEQAYRDNHISRQGTNQCDPKSGIVFLDILSNLERAGDHANNIAKKILELNSFS